jgi:hypothetical protein
VISLDGIEYAFKSIFGNASKSDIKHLLSILIAARLIKRSGQDLQFFCHIRTSKSFMEFEGIEVEALRLELIDFYNDNALEISDVIKGLADVD